VCCNLLERIENPPVTNMFDIHQRRHDIEGRNRIRVEAKLPMVSVAAELRHLYKVHQQSEFEQFFQSSPIRQRVEQKLLNRIRRLQNDPRWMPTGVLSGGGFAFYARARKVMKRVWRMQRQERMREHRRRDPGSRDLWR
jgi:hypothetical protein